MTVSEFLFPKKSKSPFKIHFPPKIRKTILKAGKSHTLVELIHDNGSWFVEPYYFEHKIRSMDHFDVEYLCGFEKSPTLVDRSKKMFSAEEIRGARSTYVSFQPRWEVRLK